MRGRGQDTSDDDHKGCKDDGGLTAEIVACQSSIEYQSSELVHSLNQHCFVRTQ